MMYIRVLSGCQAEDLAVQPSEYKNGNKNIIIKVATMDDGDRPTYSQLYTRNKTDGWS